MPKPTIEVSASFICLSIYFAQHISEINEQINEQINLSERQKMILALINKDCNISLDELSVKIGTSSATLRRDMNFLKKNGIIERKGSRKKGVWIIRPMER